MVENETFVILQNRQPIEKERTADLTWSTERRVKEHLFQESMMRPMFGYSKILKLN